jgi:complement component 1 Q subcomponent-binding protein
MYDASDEGMPEAQSGGAQSKGTINQGRTQDGNFNVAPEDQIAPGDREELMDDESADAEPSFPARLSVTIEKDGVAGAMQFEAVAHDGSISIENVYHYTNKELADVKTAEQDWSRKSVYTGPPYGNLDEDLQVLLERYLEERGVDTALAVWVPEYIDFKEQKEYMRWLNGKPLIPSECVY